MSYYGVIKTKYEMDGSGFETFKTFGTFKEAMAQVTSSGGHIVKLVECAEAPDPDTENPRRAKVAPKSELAKGGGSKDDTLK